RRLCVGPQLAKSAHPLEHVPAQVKPVLPKIERVLFGERRIDGSAAAHHGAQTGHGERIGGVVIDVNRLGQDQILVEEAHRQVEDAVAAPLEVAYVVAGERIVLGIEVLHVGDDLYRRQDGVAEEAPQDAEEGGAGDQRLRIEHAVE